MTGITVTRTINAPIELIFKTITDIGNFPQVAPDVQKIEFLSEIKSGVGARFCETRLMNGKESKTKLEVTEYVENDRIRMVADSHGTIWDSIFSLNAAAGQTELLLTMEAKAHKFLPKLMNPLLKDVYKKGLEKHLDSLKAYCEKRN